MRAAWLHPGVSGHTYSLALSVLLGAEGLCAYAVAGALGRSWPTTTRGLLELCVASIVVLLSTLLGFRGVLAASERTAHARTRLGVCLATAWGAYTVLGIIVWLRGLAAGPPATPYAFLNVVRVLPGASMLALFFSVAWWFVWMPIGALAFVLVQWLAPPREPRHS
jgi:hypothetical protein